ncbi:MAG: tetratricopeptide repeat protein [Candidatus Thermoplasmatota archaeon]|nr:tetratricopeptide repeat protein [Euryarchaeota archaeon]MBU4032565.1 tetratricopeptide repeat protein [Candidatus Thermoplasmatota archaeon]MBU4070547.1 tetratricopeptide repeat protein [Candidatus Thermoplasmatota archaeon]MBU4144656.1 tetratricopeptide repeat protein [Candidatus Thermoplasmatota archaeon]MBU4592729.1 tetratricopeptide repeat protein [Candidatus Thermoplasmatota archaeon]
MTDIETELIKGELLLAEFEYEKARKKFNDIIKANPNNARAHFGKAEASLGVQKVKAEDIMELYKKATELDPTNVFFMTSLGSFCLLTGKFQDAEACYNKATELDEENSPDYFAEFAIGYFKSAQIVYENHIDRDPKTMDMINKKALEYMLKAINLTPDKAKLLL